MKSAPKCRQCRREGLKLFLKGEKCFMTKCPFTHKSYPPGLIKTKRSSKNKKISEYGRQLREKQKLKRIFGVSEIQLKKYFFKAKKIGNLEETLFSLLERRLDNVIFRLGFAESRRKARQLVSHKHFLINNRTVNIPSFQIKTDDKIRVKKSLKKCFDFLPKKLEKYSTPSWLKLDAKNLEGAIIGLPQKENFEKIVDIPLVIEYYSKY